MAMTAQDPESDIQFVGSIYTENGREVEVGVINEQQGVRTDKKGKPICVPFLDHRAIDYIAAQMREMVDDKYDCVTMITGRRRIGKSNLGIQIARKVDPEFSINNVAFHVDAFSQLLDQNPSADPEKGIYPQAFYDEAGFGLFAKDWMHNWVKEVGKCLQVVGKKRNICYFILPHIKKLVGDIRDEMAYIWIDLDFGYKHERGYAEVYTGTRDKFKQLIWWNPKCCFKYNELADEFWTEYESRKDQFISEVASGKYDSSKKEKDSMRFNRALYEMTKMGMSPDDLADKFDIGASTVYRRITEHKSSIGNGNGTT